MEANPKLGELMERCGHLGPAPHPCEREAGHDGPHTFYEKTGEWDYRVHEWNDDGEGPVKEQGREFKLDYEEGATFRAEMLRLAIADAHKSLPSGTVFELRARLVPEDLNPVEMRPWGIAWYLVPKQPARFEGRETATEPLFLNDVDDGEVIEHGGYLLLGRVKAD